MSTVHAGVQEGDMRLATISGQQVLKSTPKLINPFNLLVWRKGVEELRGVLGSTQFRQRGQ